MDSKTKNILNIVLKDRDRLGLKLSLKKETEDFTDKLFYALFDSETPIVNSFSKLEKQFNQLLKLSQWNTDKSIMEVWNSFINGIPKILKLLNLDAQAFLNSDPAAISLSEIYMAYPGFYAIAIYRLAHELQSTSLPLIPRMMTEFAHSKTGIDINPGATIGKSFFIDHGTGIVIGEETIIKDNVRIYQGVTLGGLFVAKHLRKTKRHPTIESNVTIYANATILGGKTIIGENSIIGGNTFITKSIPKNSKIYYRIEDISTKSVNF